MSQLNEMQLHPKFHQLDIDDLDSICKFRDYLKENYGGLDVLVNNAGTAFEVSEANGNYHFLTKRGSLIELEAFCCFKLDNSHVLKVCSENI